MNEKICKDCVHYFISGKDFPLPLPPSHVYHQCHRKESGKVDLVTGYQEPRSCRVERATDFDSENNILCGPSGRFYKKEISIKPWYYFLLRSE